MEKFTEEKYVKDFAMTLPYIIKKLLSHQSAEAGKTVRKSTIICNLKVQLCVVPVLIFPFKPPCTARCCA